MRARRPGLAAVVLLVLGACGDESPARPDDAYSRATHFEVIAALPDQGLRGRTIHADGRYESWALETGSDQRRRLRTFRVPPAEVAGFFDALRELGFLDLAPAEGDPPAAYASGMALHGPDGVHRVWWARAQDAPGVLRIIPQTLARWEHEGG